MSWSMWKKSDTNKIKIDKKSHKNILIYYIGYKTVKNLRYVKIDILNLLYLIVNKISRYFEKRNRNKYLTLVPTDKSKDTVKKYEELWSVIRDLIRSITDNSDKNDEKYIKVKLNLNDDLPLNKTLELRNMIIVVTSVFHKGNKHYPQVFLEECLYKLWII